LGRIEYPESPFLTDPKLDFAARLMLLPFKSSVACQESKSRIYIEKISIPFSNRCVGIPDLALNQGIQGLSIHAEDLTAAVWTVTGFA
jgi:hypothetical protein